MVYYNLTILTLICTALDKVFRIGRENTARTSFGGKVSLSVGCYLLDLFGREILHVDVGSLVQTYLLN